MQPEEIAARVWPGREVELEPLGGGITNRNFKATVGGESFVLRIGGKDTALLGIDRYAEHAATSIAAGLEIGPEVVAFVEPEGYLVTRFVEGSPLPVEEMRRTEDPAPDRRDAAAAARRPVFPGRFDSFRVVEAYSGDRRDSRRCRSARVRAGEADGRRDRAHARASARVPLPQRPAQRELHPRTTKPCGSSTGSTPAWATAFFDLANFSVNHELSDDQNEELLTAYFGGLAEADLRALRLMRFMSDFREAMWGVVQQGLSELDFDFAGYANEHFARLERTAADPAFRELLQ